MCELPKSLVSRGNCVQSRRLSHLIHEHTLHMIPRHFSQIIKWKCVCCCAYVWKTECLPILWWSHKRIGHSFACKRSFVHLSLHLHILFVITNNPTNNERVLLRQLLRWAANYATHGHRRGAFLLPFTIPWFTPNSDKCCFATLCRMWFAR